MRPLFFVYTRWPGGIYASATLPGSKPGAPVAAAWASLSGLGRDGLSRLAGEALVAARRLRVGLGAIPGIAIVGDPKATIVAWRSVDAAVDIFAVADQLAARGWSVDRQQRPACIHNTVNASNGPVVDAYVADVTQAVAWVRAHPEAASRGEAAMYGLSARVPVPGLVKPAVIDAMEQLYAAEERPAGVGLDLPAPLQRLANAWVGWRRRREALRS